MMVRVQVRTGMRKEIMTVLGDDLFDLRLKVPAERNQANRRVRELLAKWYTVPVGQVKIVTGHHSPRKIIEVLLE